MCCRVLIKLLEWSGMLHLTIYSFLTIIYVLAHTFIAIALTYYYHEPLDLLLTLFALFISSLLYV